MRKQLTSSTAHHRSRCLIPVSASGLYGKPDFTLEGLKLAIGGLHIGITANAGVHRMPIMSRLLGHYIQSLASRQYINLRHPHRFLCLLKRYPTCFLPAWSILPELYVLKAIPLAFGHDNPSLSLIHLDKVLRVYGGLGVLTTFSDRRHLRSAFTWTYPMSLICE